jgi:hypothetical protein
MVLLHKGRKKWSNLFSHGIWKQTYDKLWKYEELVAIPWCLGFSKNPLVKFNWLGDGKLYAWANGEKIYEFGSSY